MTAYAAAVLTFDTAQPTYTMRGYDETLAQLVYWFTTDIDNDASAYTGPGPVTDIVVHAIKGR